MQTLRHPFVTFAFALHDEDNDGDDCDEDEDGDGDDVGDGVQGGVLYWFGVISSLMNNFAFASVV